MSRKGSCWPSEVGWWAGEGRAAQARAVSAGLLTAGDGEPLKTDFPQRGVYRLLASRCARIQELRWGPGRPRLRKPLHSVWWGRSCQQGERLSPSIRARVLGWTLTCLRGSRVRWQHVMLRRFYKIIFTQTPTANGQHQELSVQHGSRLSQRHAGRAGPLLTPPCWQRGVRGCSRGPEGVCAECRSCRDTRRKPPAASLSACSPLLSSGA